MFDAVTERCDDARSVIDLFRQPRCYQLGS